MNFYHTVRYFAPVVNCYFGSRALPEIFLSDVTGFFELAEMADPDVALEAHDNGDVDRAHHRDLDKG